MEFCTATEHYCTSSVQAPIKFYVQVKLDFNKLKACVDFILYTYMCLEIDVDCLWNVLLLLYTLRVVFERFSDLHVNSYYGVCQNWLLFKNFIYFMFVFMDRFHPTLVISRRHYIFLLLTVPFNLLFIKQNLNLRKTKLVKIFLNNDNRWRYCTV